MIMGENEVSLSLEVKMTLNTKSADYQGMNSITTTTTTLVQHCTTTSSLMPIQTLFLFTFATKYKTLLAVNH